MLLLFYFIWLVGVVLFWGVYGIFLLSVVDKIVARVVNGVGEIGDGWSG